jgi:CRISPR/Cas system endoribonuclease Cas6 (RAMP superfamily)
MRLRLTLQVIGKCNTLPLNYQYELSSWIYKTRLQNQHNLLV